MSARRKPTHIPKHVYDYPYGATLEQLERDRIELAEAIRRRRIFDSNPANSPYVVR